MSSPTATPARPTTSLVACEAVGVS
ncbi:MAG: hypothetical protein QOE67_538, partial [Solirubrobacteraceae bacterium]|nr:hypothetical protein [Solirubrobacteraceae bacterium]